MRCECLCRAAFTITVVVVAMDEQEVMSVTVLTTGWRNYEELNWQNSSNNLNTGQARHICLAPRSHSVCSPVISTLLAWPGFDIAKVAGPGPVPAGLLVRGSHRLGSAQRLSHFLVFVTWRLAARAVAHVERTQLASFLLLSVPMFPWWPSYLQ